MEPDDLLCSRNARPPKALVERAQWKINQPPSLKRYRVSSEGAIRKDKYCSASFDGSSANSTPRPGMMKKSNLICFVGGVLVCAWSLFPLLTLAAGEEGDESALKEVREVVKQLQARYEKTKDLQADFTQKTTIEGFERSITSSGKVFIKKPGRLRWNYLDPSVEDIYVNRNDVKVYVPEHKQVLVGKLTQMAASKAPLELLLGAAKLDESFDIEQTPGKGRGVGGIRLLTLLPKTHEGEAGRSLQRIVLEVFPKTYFIRTISLYEVSGNVASFEFSSLQPNVGLSDSLFDLKLPADVEVVRAPVLNGP
jgi:outer membrane lipoprotein carrier protein